MSADINKVVLVGRLTRDPELRATGGGMTILSMRLAFTSSRKNNESGQWEDTPNYIDVTMFGARADALSRFLQKGKQIAIDGKLRWREWQTPDGDKRSAIEVVADEVQLLGSREDGNAYAGAAYDRPAKPAASAPTIDDEDIPF